MPRFRSRQLLACLALVASGCNIVLGLDDLVADRDPGAGAGGSSGGGDQTGGGGSSGGCSGTCGTPGCRPCPETSLIVIPAAAGTFSIDKYEVTNADYALFLADAPGAALAPPACADNTSYEPGILTEIGFDPADIPATVAACDNWKQFDSEPNKPVACVDWCDAYAYCAWAGKRLCGDFSGNLYDVTNGAGPHADPAVSQWFAACTGPNGTAFPYGDVYDDARCSDDNGGPEPAGAHPTCEGGYPGLFDMSGNMGEWDNACTDYNNPDYEQNCLVRGGNWYQVGADAQCDAFRDTRRYNLSDGIGFRCCSDG